MSYVIRSCGITKKELQIEVFIDTILECLKLIERSKTILHN